MLQAVLDRADRAGMRVAQLDTLPTLQDVDVVQVGGGSSTNRCCHVALWWLSDTPGTLKSASRAVGTLCCALVVVHVCTQ